MYHGTWVAIPGACEFWNSSDDHLLAACMSGMYRGSKNPGACEFRVILLDINPGCVGGWVGGWVTPKDPKMTTIMTSNLSKNEHGNWSKTSLRITPKPVPKWHQNQSQNDTETSPKTSPKTRPPEFFRIFQAEKILFFLTISFLTEFFRIFQAEKIWFFRLHFATHFGVIVVVILVSFWWSFWDWFWCHFGARFLWISVFIFALFWCHFGCHFGLLFRNHVSIHLLQFFAIQFFEIPTQPHELIWCKSEVGEWPRPGNRFVRSITFAWDLPLGIFRLGAFACELSLGNFRSITFACLHGLSTHINFGPSPQTIHNEIWFNCLI